MICLDSLIPDECWMEDRVSLVDYLTIAMFGAGTLAALSIGFAWVFARLYCKPKRRLPTKTPANYGLPFVPVTFRSHDVPLQGWFIPLDGNSVSPPTIILAHGWSNNAAQMLPVACALHQAGFGVLLYDARGHGGSGGDGPITILKMAEDLIAAVDYLAGRPDVDMTRLGAVGHSLGGGSVILAASIELRIRAVVSTSAFADPVALTWGFHARATYPAVALPVARLSFHRTLARREHGRRCSSKSNWSGSSASATHPRRI